MHYPIHIGFIPDGNRTRAAHHNLPEAMGYKKGMHVGIDIIRHVLDHTPIRAITGRFLSTENVLQRSSESLSQLLDLAMIFFSMIDDDLVRTRTNFAWIGSRVGLPAAFLSYLDEKEKTFDFGGERWVIFAVNYGGQDEIMRAIHAASVAGHDMATLDAKIFHSYTDMGRFPALDLVIRTKGDHAKRTSGFASRQIGYAELAFTQTLCPDFTVAEFDTILQRYDSIVDERNFGK